MGHQRNASERRALVFGAVLLITGCADDRPLPGPMGPPADIDGGWLLVEHLAGEDVQCNDTVDVRIVQSGDAFSSRGYRYGSCGERGSGPVPVSSHLDAENGRVTGPAVSFSDEQCSYTGRKADGEKVVSGTVRCRLVVPTLFNRLVTGRWEMRPADFVPPSVAIALDMAAPTHGDTLRVTVHASDDVALAHVGGVFEYDRANHPDCLTNPPAVADSVTVSGDAASAEFTSVVPGCMGSVVITVFARDTAKNRSEARSERKSLTFPTTEIAASVNDTVFTLGDTLRLRVEARNPRGLSRIGYRWGNPNFVAEVSVEATGTQSVQEFALPVSRDAPINQLWVEPFARHDLGWLTTIDMIRTRVTDAVRLPTQQLALPGPPGDVVHSARADRIYFTNRAAASVHEVRLSPFSLGDAWALPVPGASLDLTVSEDSILVALAGRNSLAVIRRGTGTLTTVSPTGLGEINLYDVRRVRVVGDGLAMLGVGSGSGGHIVALNLSDGTQRLRVPWYGYGTFERTPGRSRLLVVDFTSPIGTQLYLAATDTFLPHRSQPPPSPGPAVPAGPDDASTNWLIGCHILTPDILSTPPFSDPHVDAPRLVLALHGDRAYCPRRDGFVEFDVSTGMALRAVWLPIRPERVIALPGRRVLAIFESTMYLITLP